MKRPSSPAFLFSALKFTHQNRWLHDLLRFGMPLALISLQKRNRGNAYHGLSGKEVKNKLNYIRARSATLFYKELMN